MTTPDPRPPLLVLIGPTAVGKTALSLDIAKRFRCEIISGDSMQVYRRMDIGTAKLPPEERAGIPHHLIDIREPDEPFSVADFQRLCAERIRDIWQRRRLPFIVGGTGLYIESVCYGYQFHQQSADPAFRERMKAISRARGPQALHERLSKIDPAAAARIHPNDERRIIRALELYETTGRPMSEVQRQTRAEPKISPYRLCLIGLTMERETLYRRIDERVDLMLRQGLVEEVSRLLREGVPRDAVSMQGLGYKEIAAFLAGETDLDTAVETLKRNTRRFAKRQLSWFRRMPDVHWIEIGPQAKKSDLFETICDIIAGKFPFDLEYICS